MIQRRSDQAAAAIGKAISVPCAKLRGHRFRSPMLGPPKGSAVCIFIMRPASYRNQPISTHEALEDRWPETRKSPTKLPKPSKLPSVAAVSAALAGLICAPAAFAQDMPVTTPADLIETQRPNGVRVGAFEIIPQASLDMGYDDNVYNLDQFRLKDGFVKLRPSVTIDADFARHDWRFGFSSEITRYFDLVQENSEQATAFVAGRLDFADRISVSPTVSIARRLEPRGTAGDTLFTDEPVEYLRKYGSLAIARTGARIEARARISYDELDYSSNSINGQPLDLTGRNATRIATRAAVYYEVSPDFQLLAGASYNALDYQIDTIVPRGSNGHSVFGGIRAQVSDLIDAELAVGFGRQKFDNPGIDDFQGLDFELTMRWTPKPRIQVTALGSRSVERSPLLAAAAVVQTRAGTALQYALGSKLLFGAQAGFNHDDFRGIDRAESRFTLGSSLRYLINDRLSTFIAGSYRNQSGEGLNAREYQGFALSVGVTIAP